MKLFRLVAYAALMFVLFPFAAFAQDVAVGGLDPVALIGSVVSILLANLGATGLAIAGFIGAVAVLAARIPNKSKSPWIQSLLTLANKIGQNTGKAANDPKLP